MDVAHLLHTLQACRPEQKAIFGFDAFIDRISHHVSGLGDGTIGSMTELGSRLIARDNKSGAVFLEDVQELIGGNAPNTAKTLGTLGANVTCICALGYPHTKEVFLPLEEYCRLISYAEPGTCLAVELGQSKLFFSHNGEMEDITWDAFCARLGKDRLLKKYADADLIGLFNWGELSSTQRIWDGMLEDIFPHLPHGARTLFFDFSDISARSDADLKKLKETLTKFRQYGKVYVSANQLESRLLNGGQWVQDGICDIFITHGKTEAALIGQDEAISLPTRFQPAPKRLTGGGDSFNAGFCYALMCSLDHKSCLMVANAVANCLITTQTPPDLAALCDEIQKCRDLWA